jgi:precorrin-2 methylase
VAAAAEFAVGEGKQPVTIIPMADDLTDLGGALERCGTVVIMKVGKRLDSVLDALESHHALEAGVFGAHVGMADEHVERDLRKLRGQKQHTGYLSTILTRIATEDPS